MSLERKTGRLYGESPERYPARVSTKEYFEGQDVPPIKFEIAYGRHADKSDTPQLESIFSRSDIFIMEAHGWKPSRVQKTNEVAEGNLKGTVLYLQKKMGLVEAQALEKVFEYAGIPLAFGTPGFNEKINDMIYNSRKPVVFVDVPKTHPLRLQMDAIEYEQRRFISEIVNPNKLRLALDDTLDHYARIQRKFADNQRDREDYMVRQVNGVLAELLRQRPDLKSNPELTVSMFLGAYHTRVHHLLKQRGENVERAFDEKSKLYSPTETLLRHFGLDIQEKPSRELVLKALFDSIVVSHIHTGAWKISFPGLPKSKFDQADFWGKIIHRFTSRELEDLWQTREQGKGMFLTHITRALIAKAESSAKSPFKH